MMMERNRRASIVKLLVQSVVSAGDKGKVEDINKALTRYMDTEFRLADVYENTDMLMMEEYEQIKKLKATAEIDRDGTLVVKGIIGELNLGDSDGV